MHSASKCVPKPVLDVKSALEALLRNGKDISIQTNEAAMEASSILAGFRHVQRPDRDDPVLPALILLAGSTSSQFVYVNVGEVITSTFTMRPDTTATYRELVGVKLGMILPRGAPVKSLFLCSGFAFAIVQASVGNTDFLQQYFADVPDEARSKYIEAVPKAKPSQVAPMPFSLLVDTVKQLSPYERDPAVQNTLNILVELLTHKIDPTAYVYVFKEITKDGSRIKAGAAHGVAMTLVQ